MKFSKVKTFAFILTAFMLGCNEFMVVGVLSNIARSYHVSLSTIGFLVTSFALIYAISTPIVTTLTSRFDRYWLLMVLMGIFLLANTLTALAPNLFWLFASRILTASVAGTLITTIYLYVNLLTPMAKKPLVIAWVGAGFSIASVIGVPIGTTIATLANWHWSFLLISALTVIVYILLAKIIPHARPKKASGIKGQLVLLKDHRVLLGIGVTMAVLALQYTFYTYIRSLITTVMGFSLNQLNWMLFILGVMSIIGNQVAGEVASHGGTKTLPLVFLLMIAGCLTLGLALRHQLSGMIVLSILCLLVIVHGPTIQLVFMNTAAKSYPQSMALATSLISIFSNLGISIGSFTASITVHSLSLTSVGYVAAIYGLIALALVLGLNHQPALEQE